VLFNSYLFIFLFLPVVLVVFYTFNNKKLSTYWLIGASFFFYAWWNYVYLTLLLFSIFFNYYTGTLLIHSRDGNTKYQKSIILVGICVNLSILGYFKYFNFFIDNINVLFRSEFQEQSIILPLAISFYTFQQIAYLVDTYRSESSSYQLSNYCLFVSFFPQLIAGPIVRHNNTIPQFKMNVFNKFIYTNISVGLTIFIIGLFKKVVLADGIAPFATSVFNAASRGETIYFIESWCGAISYTFQLYFDFSGYSDMAIGLGRMFNVYLPLNFYSPYRCISIIDFWKQWHMTLSLFLRDYLYVPLGGNRKGNRYINLMTTMLLGGLWHGAGWTFIVWGGLHGLYLVINHYWRLLKIRLSIREFRYSILSNVLYFLLTFLAIVVAWVFFRSDNLFTAKKILCGMIGLNGVNLPQGYLTLLGPISAFLLQSGVIFQSDILPSYTNIFLWIFLLSIIIWFFPNTYELMGNYDSALKVSVTTNYRGIAFKWQPSVLWAIIVSIMFSVCIIFMSSASEFLYFNF